MKTRKIFGQPSFVIGNGVVQAAITEVGGHLGPVTFRAGRRKIQPFSVAPWWNEKLPAGTPNLLRVLRGDFFCLPFGGNAKPWRGEKHPPHGETANARWKFEAVHRNRDEATLELSLKTKVRPGRVLKRIRLLRGQPVLYQEHVISGMTGPMSLGHHAMLKFPDAEGAGRLSTSKFILGQVFVEPAEQPSQRGYSVLKPGATFERLDAVPDITGQTADLSRYPARRGFEDIAMLVADPTLKLAWNAVAFPEEGYVWFSLRDPRVLASTVLWISNGGRHYPPWNGRHVNVMGVEDVTAWFHYGLAQSAEANPLTTLGYPTHKVLSADAPLSVRYIMAVAPIGKRFERVANIEWDDRSVTLHGEAGEVVKVAVDVAFLGI
ncbi:MAG: hypothetical protein N3B01_03585 [Verrucomicrobiae bacterium]|nr:hypothetical protein [Verrucomicrobiae bacterium]